MADPEIPTIQIDDLVREMTPEEVEAYEAFVAAAFVVPSA